jgi:hypothetical protein
MQVADQLGYSTASRKAAPDEVGLSADSRASPLLHDTTEDAGRQILERASLGVAVDGRLPTVLELLSDTSAGASGQAISVNGPRKKLDMNLSALDGDISGTGNWNESAREPPPGRSQLTLDEFRKLMSDGDESADSL